MNNAPYHFIGIGGIGMSALARICLEKNIKVTGSDIAPSETTKNLSVKGAHVFIGHSETHITPESTVIYSSSVTLDNPEYKFALKNGCRVLHRSDLLNELMQHSKTLAVTGTHGKTTTTALLTTVLNEANMEPSFAVGGITLGLKTNGAHGKGEYFVAEADESDGTFLKYLPFGAIVTNIDFDHMDFFKTKENLFDSFKTFFSKSSKYLFFCGDDSELSKINEQTGTQGISYGLLESNLLRLSNFKQKGWHSFFDIKFEGKIHENVELSLIGEHNALNALAVFGLCLKLGIEHQIIRKAFQSFKGVGRRVEKKSEANGILMVDDYAHHPTEIEATLKGVRSAVLEKRLITVYQPHRYSRTESTLGSFKNVFNESSELIITDIYAAGETPIPGISHENILVELKDLKIPVSYVPRKALAKTLQQHLRPHDVLISLGAGDITNLAQEILNESQDKLQKKLKVGLVFGGRSSEHEISIRSARNIANSLNPIIYDITLFGISKTGVWNTGVDLLSLNAINTTAKNSISTEVMQQIDECDLFFPILHGSFGEDGTIQGFFEMINKPYVGCDYRASAICMDKIITKQLMILNNISTSAFFSFTHHEWKLNPANIIENIVDQLNFPVYVKPTHLGSSIGVSRVSQIDEIHDAIELAFKHDFKILVEMEVKGREIEFATLGNDHVHVFPPGEIVTNGKVYTYEGKYLSKEIQTKTKAAISDESLHEGMALAKSAYKIAGCQGLARVDFFLDEQGKYWFNEINPLPGFTSISLYPEICAANGLKGMDLIDRLIILSLEKKRTKQTYEF